MGRHEAEDTASHACFVPQCAAVRTTRLPLAIALTLAISTAISGCYFTRSPLRPLQALQFRRSAAAPDRCLIVMIPGFLDGPDSFRDNGFPSDVVRSGAECDSLAVDLHYRYYWGSEEERIGQIVYEDILAPATARGYEEIWLVGISMGGLGALLGAEAHPELVAGVILLAPYVGEEAVVREIDAAGGAEAWHPPQGIDDQPWTQANYTAHLWSWLRGYATDPDDMPPLYVGWGEEDGLGTGDRLLAAMQPEDHVITHPGNHGWSTWRPIFRELLETAHPGR